MTKGPNPTIAVHLTQKELSALFRLLSFPQSYGELGDKISKAIVDIRPIIREARRVAKQTNAQAERQAKRDRQMEEFFKELTQDLEIEIPPTAGRGGW